MAFLPYGDLSIDAISLYLRCRRVHEKNTPNLSIDRAKLKELGDYIGKLSKEGYKDFKKAPELLKNVEGISLAMKVEEEYLKDSPRYDCSRIRELGVDSLEKLGEVLSSAEDSSKFDIYAEPLAELFKEWHDVAEELSLPISKGLPRSIGETILRFPSK